MPDRDEFPIPNVINPPKRRCLCIPVPDDAEHVRIVAGLFQQLTYWFNWQRDTAKSGKELAKIYAEIFDCVDWGYPVHGGSCVPVYEESEPDVKTKISVADLAGDYLENKVKAGENIEIEVIRGVGYETLEIKATIPPVPPPFTVGDFKYSAQTADHDGWLLCDGRYFAPGIYPELDDVIHGRYGDPPIAVGSLLPDARGRMLLTIGSGAGLTPRSFGNVGGEESVVLAVSEMPEHNHNFTSGTAAGTGAYPVRGNSTIASPNHATASRGGNAAHENMPPYVGIGNLFIYAGQ